MSISATPSIWNAVEIAIRGAKRSSAHSSSSCGSWSSNSTASSPASRSSSSLVGAHAASFSARAFAGSRPARTPSSSSVDPVARTPGTTRRRPASRASRRRGRSTVASSSSVGTRRKTGRAIAARGAEAAAQEDVVGLPALPLVVAHGRALEAEVADPVLGAGVRAAVEVELQARDVVAEALLEVPDQRVGARLRLGHGVVAVRLAGAGDRRAADGVDVEREADLRELATVTRRAPPRARR